MLASTKPRSPTPRVSRTPQHPPVSYPFSVPSRPSSQASLNSARRSSPSTPKHGHRPSISNTMHWLSRSNSSQSSSSPYTSAKQTRISEPKLIRSNDLLSHPRSGALGSGATVVRTPDEALRETGVRLPFEGKPDISTRSLEVQKTRSSVTSRNALAPVSLPSPATSTSELSLTSPPLPSLPKLEGEGPDLLEASKPPRPTRAPPSAPSASLRSSLRRRPVQQVEDVITIPPLPGYLSTGPIPPSFRPIMVSEVPTGAVDHDKIIVTIETSTASHKTTLETLKSRPSHLSEYLRSLFPTKRSSIASSIYSHVSDDISTSQGFLSQVSFNVHLFLDRPSIPYPHILSYLRSVHGSPDAPETLPRSIQMLPSNQQLESLLELRDEAAYLGLEGLRKLCVDELRLRHRLHTRGKSTTTTAQSMQGSVYSLHALLESVESDIQSNSRDSRSSGSTSAKDSPVDTMASRLLHTPQSWNGSSRSLSEERHTSAHSSPPVGWI